MNSLYIVIFALVFFYFAYRFFTKRLEALMAIDTKRATPAFSKFDSVDFVPAKNWLVLFGHHFSSIAGAGPIVGPVIACALWGWLPALIWIVVGTVFIGGVHDFGSLIISVREGGRSIADIAEQVISRRAKILFSLFVWLALILVIAVFAYLCADTFVKEPKIVAPSLGLIPVAVLVGACLYNIKTNPVITTIFGLTLLTGLMFLGNKLPITLGQYSLYIWIAVLFIYCYFASVLPVNILLQPRDYLSSFLLFFGVAAGLIGIIISRPIVNAPFYNAWSTSEGSLWPAMFITVACGAISGFHALIASGTTSKQIASERHVSRIGYGGMIAEGIVAVLAVIAVSACFIKGVNPVLKLKQLGPINLFGQGYGMITKKILGPYGHFIALAILNAFILTTLDTATRISRYLTEELFQIKNRFASTLLVIAASSALAFSGKWQKIWPAFGASNQLVAALALFVISCWLLSRKKTMKFTLPAAIFMLVTTLFALSMQSLRFFKAGDYGLSIISILLIILAGFMVFDVFKVLRRHPAI